MQRTIKSLSLFGGVSAFLTLPLLAAPVFADGISGIGGLSWSLGRMSNGTNTIQSRTVDVFDLHAMPGWKFGQYLAGVMAQYRWVGQTTDPATVGNSNLAGHGYYAGVGGAANVQMIRLQASFDFLGSESLSNNTSNGQSVTYSQAMGFTMIAGYKVTPQISVDGIFGYHNFSHQNLGGTTEIDISSNKLNETHYGIGVSYEL